MGRFLNLTKTFRTPLLFLCWVKAYTIESHLDTVRYGAVAPRLEVLLSW